MAPFSRIRRIITVVRTFQITVGEFIDIPRRRYLYPDIIPGIFERRCQLRSFSFAIDIFRRKRDSLEIPGTVQTYLFPIRRLCPVDKAFGRCKDMRECRKKASAEQNKRFQEHNKSGFNLSYAN